MPRPVTSRATSLTDLPARHRRGRVAEEAAARMLTADGFRLLWRNLRLGPLELDLVAVRGDLVVVVEVRARGAGAFEKPLASVSRTKRLSILRAARTLWRSRLSRMRGIRRMRIDVAAFHFDAGDRWSVEWIAGAFTADDA